MALTITAPYMMAFYITGMMVIFRGPLLRWNTCPMKALVIFIASTLIIARLLIKLAQLFVLTSHVSFKDQLLLQRFLLLKKPTHIPVGMSPTRLAWHYFSFSNA